MSHGVFNHVVKGKCYSRVESKTIQNCDEDLSLPPPRVNYKTKKLQCGSRHKHAQTCVIRRSIVSSC